MAARAMWKGVIQFGAVQVPVKFYSAVEDRSVHFRLLHEPDGVPLRRRMVHPTTGETAEYDQVRRGLEIERDLFVVLDPEELEALEPPASRDIEVTRFLEGGRIGHQWYARPYFLGPDGSESRYFAFARALTERNREAVARWVMRKKAYLGVLQGRGDHLLMMTLRHAEEVIPVESLEAPEGRALEEREQEMAGRFVKALEERFDPSEYRDEYRQRVLEVIEAKRRGESVPAPRYEERPPSDDLAELLERSLAGIG